MDQDVRELLDAADDATNVERDPALDRPAIHARVAVLRPELERIAGRTFVPDDRGLVAFP